MSHSKVKIWVHGILGVKNREQLIKRDIENQIHELIKKEIIEMNYFLKIINGTENHIHILFLLNPQKTTSEVFKQLKGSTINQKKLTKKPFSWQVGYGAFSVSESGINKAVRYIEKQKEHHKKISFQEEYQKFIQLYHITIHETLAKRKAVGQSSEPHVFSMQLYYERL